MARCPMCGASFTQWHRCPGKSWQANARQEWDQFLKDSEEPLVPWDVSSDTDLCVIAELNDPIYVQRMVRMWERAAK